MGFHYMGHGTLVVPCTRRYFVYRAVTYGSRYLGSTVMLLMEAHTVLAYYRMLRNGWFSVTSRFYTFSKVLGFNLSSIFSFNTLSFLPYS